MSIEDFQNRKAPPTDILGSRFRSEAALNFSPLRQGDNALSAVVGDGYGKDSYVVHDSTGKSFFDFALAGDIYGKSPFTEAAKERADDKLKTAALA
jgi:hypothetical protein